MVWNPLFEMNTVWRNAECLEQEGHVWWPKLRSRPVEKTPEAELREEAQQELVLQVSQEAKSAQRDLLVYVTDYLTLHVLRVRDVVVGPHLQMKDLEPMLKYSRVKMDIAAAFDVVDIMQVESEQIGTLDYLWRELRFSPYASERSAFPLRRQGPSLASLFGEGTSEPKHRKLVPKDYMEAKARAATKLFTPELWSQLGDPAKEYFATAVMKQALHEAAHGPSRKTWNDFERKAAGLAFREVLLHLGLALESEWRRLNEELRRLGYYAEDKLPRERVSEFGTLRIDDVDNLGSAHMVLKALGQLSQREVEVPRSLLDLVENDRWRQWVGSFADWRNENVHPGSLDEVPAERIWEVFGTPRELFEPILAALGGREFKGNFVAPRLPETPGRRRKRLDRKARSVKRPLNRTT